LQDQVPQGTLQELSLYFKSDYLRSIGVKMGCFILC